MTDFNVLKSWLIILFAASPIIMSLVSITHTLYITRHLTALLKAMENSKVILMLGGASEPNDIVGRFLLVGQIASFAVWPKFAIKGGFVNRKDIENFPPKLLKMLKINMIILQTTTIWWLTFYAALKLELLD